MLGNHRRRACSASPKAVWCPAERSQGGDGRRPSGDMSGAGRQDRFQASERCTRETPRTATLGNDGNEITFRETCSPIRNSELQYAPDQNTRPADQDAWAKTKQETHPDGHLHLPHLPLPRPRRPHRRRAPAQTPDRHRRRPGRPGRRHRRPAARPGRAAVRRRRQRLLRLARRLLRQASTGDPRPPRRRRHHRRQGRELERRPHLHERRRGLPLQPRARRRPQAPGHDQPAAVPPRRSAGEARGSAGC